MSLDPLLLDLLACPIDKQALLYLPAEGILYNPRLRRGYEVRDGVPVLLADQGKTVTDERHADLLRRARAAAAAKTPGATAGITSDSVPGAMATLGVPLDELLRDPVTGTTEDATSA